MSHLEEARAIVQQAAAETGLSGMEACGRFSDIVLGRLAWERSAPPSKLEDPVDEADRKLAQLRRLEAFDHFRRQIAEAVR
jgi:hypothetical protein